MAEFSPPPQNDPSLRAGNMQSTPEKVNVAGYVERLLANKKLDGEEIIDRFIGAVVANGEVQGSVDTYTPETILDIVSSVARAQHEALAQPEGSEEQQRAIEAASKMSAQITNKNGYRDAFYALADDERTTDLMHLGGSYASLLGRAGLGDNKKGFASLDALHSYLLVTSENYVTQPDHDVATAAEAASVDGVMSAVELYARGGHGNVGFRGLLDNLVTFSVESDRTKALESKRHLATLEQRGASVNLIESTAQRLRMYRRYRGLGAMAGKHVRVQGFGR